MSGRWFRLYDELVDDPKVQMLPDRLFRALINLWCLACRNDGALPPLPEIAFSLRMPESKVAAILAELRDAGLIDDDDDGNSTPHNWGSRQFRSDVSTDRVKRYRERRRNVSSTVPRNGNGTPPDTETDTDTVADATDVGASAHDGPTLRDEFDRQFWPEYPHKVGKPKALSAYRTARKRHSADAILAGLRRYVASKPAARNWLNPATFLNQERFHDQPADPPDQRARQPAAGAHDALLGAVARRFAPVPADGRPGQADPPGEPPAGPEADDPGPRLDFGPDAFRRH